MECLSQSWPIPLNKKRVELREELYWAFLLVLLQSWKKKDGSYGIEGTSVWYGYGYVRRCLQNRKKEDTILPTKLSPVSHYLVSLIYYMEATLHSSDLTSFMMSSRVIINIILTVITVKNTMYLWSEAVPLLLPTSGSVSERTAPKGKERTRLARECAIPSCRLV